MIMTDLLTFTRWAVWYPIQSPKHQNATSLKTYIAHLPDPELFVEKMSILSQRLIHLPVLERMTCGGHDILILNDA